MSLIVVFNLTFCLIILLLSIWWCIRAGSGVPLLIGIAFGLFGVSHTATLLQLTETYKVPLVVIRSTAYIMVALGIFLSTLDIIRRKRAEDELRKSHEELERRVETRTEELASANDSLRAEVETRSTAEEALRRANRKLNLLSDITRHDINNQILGLKTFLRRSDQSLGDTGKARELIAREQEAVDAIERQIAFTGEYQNLGVNAPVWQVVGSCAREAVGPLSGPPVHVSPEMDGLEVYADPMLEKVFVCLADNGARHGGESLTFIRLSARTSDSALVIAVENDGEGIPMDLKQRIFDRGYGSNTGYGLFLSREILSLTGIAIAETGSPEGGARFEIHVPEGTWRRKGRI